MVNISVSNCRFSQTTCENGAYMKITLLIFDFILSSTFLQIICCYHTSVFFLHMQNVSPPKIAVRQQLWIRITNLQVCPSSSTEPFLRQLKTCVQMDAGQTFSPVLPSHHS